MRLMSVFVSLSCIVFMQSCSGNSKQSQTHQIDEPRLNISITPQKISIPAKCKVKFTSDVSGAIFELYGDQNGFASISSDAVVSSLAIPNSPKIVNVIARHPSNPNNAYAVANLEILPDPIKVDHIVENNGSMTTHKYYLIYPTITDAKESIQWEINTPYIVKELSNDKKYLRINCNPWVSPTVVMTMTFDKYMMPFVIAP